MKRREFIKNVGLAAGAGVAAMSLGGMPVKAFAKPFLNIQETNGKILVIIQFKGGNDGLNTVIPIDQYSLYQGNRPNIGLALTDIVKLTDSTGLHPSLLPLKALYDNGAMTLVQNVGYLNQSRSHFRSTDIWLSGVDYNQVAYDGWVGRLLPKAFPTYPKVPPAYPMSIQLGSVGSLLFENQTYGSMEIAFQNPNAFYQLVQGISVDNDPPPETLAGDELKYLKEIANQSVQYATVIRDASVKGTHTATYPSTTLSQQLNIISNLIMGGLATPIYLVTLDGFDTHVDQQTTTRHPKLLGDFASAVSAFYNDLNNNKLADKVVMMTFSEFGRRVKENASKGTDHGAALPVFVIGKNVQGGIVGINAQLDPKKLDSNGDIQYVYDFRQIYATMIMDLFGMTSAQSKEVLGKDFQKIPIIKTQGTGVNYEAGLPDGYQLKQNYPDPFNPTTKIDYSIPSPQQVKLSVYDALGRRAAVLVDQYQGAGNYSLNFNGSNFASGTYIYILEAGAAKISKKMLLVK